MRVKERERRVGAGGLAHKHANTQKTPSLSHTHKHTVAVESIANNIQLLCNRVPNDFVDGVLVDIL